jgi:hypothetical protein
MSASGTITNFSGSIDSTLLGVNLASQGIDLSTKNSVLLRGSIKEDGELIDGLIVIGHGSLFGLIQKGEFVPEVRLELVDEINNFIEVRLISVLLGHFNKRFEDSGLLLERLDSRELVGGLDHVSHKVISLCRHFDKSWGSIVSWGGGSLLLLESVEALDGSSAAFDGLHDSGSVIGVGAIVGFSGFVSQTESLTGLSNSTGITIENILFTMSGVAPLSDFSVATGHDNRLLINNSLLVLKHQGVLLLTLMRTKSVAFSLIVQELSQLVESGEQSGVVSFTSLHFDSDQSGDRSSEWGSFDLLKNIVKHGLLTKGEEVGWLVLDSVGASY